MAKIIDMGLRLPEGVNEGDFVISIPILLPSQTDGQDKEAKRATRRPRRTPDHRKAPKGRKSR